MLEDLKMGVLDAAIGDAAVSRYYVTNTGGKYVTTAGGVFAPDNIAFAFPEDSVYFEPMNQTLIEFQQNGTYEKIRVKYFGK